MHLFACLHAKRSNVIILILITSFALISANIKLSRATKPKGLSKLVIENNA